MPRPAASKMGKMNTQNSASGSRMNSRNRTWVNRARGCAVQVAGGGDLRAASAARGSGILTSLIAQVPSRQGDEDVLQGSGMGAQFGQRNTLPVEFIEEGGHRSMEFGNQHLHTAVFAPDLADTLDLAQCRDGQRLGGVSGGK